MGMLWILIPIGALIAGAWSEWLKFKADQHKLGSSTTEIEKALEKMTEQTARLTRRIQNIEAIVTSQTWDEINESRAQTGSTSRFLDDDNPGRREEERRVSLDETEQGDAEEVARLAKRLRT